MISISKYFLEAANVPASVTIQAPFGIINPTEENNRRLAKAQDLGMKDPDVQAKEMDKLLNRS